MRPVLLPVLVAVPWVVDDTRRGVEELTGVVLTPWGASVAIPRAAIHLSELLAADGPREV